MENIAFKIVGAHISEAVCPSEGTPSLKGDFMKSSINNLLVGLGLVGFGVAIGVAGIYIGDTDDAPGASLMGILLMVGAVALAVRIVRRKT